MSPREKTARRRAGTVDLLIGGPPCQGHSTLNNHTRGRAHVHLLPVVGNHVYSVVGAIDFNPDSTGEIDIGTFE
jgi:DNA (cytosine-5)-methyltransferase 1